MKIKWHLLLTISVLIFFISLLGLERVFTHFPWYDDAYNATVAKNLASGYGYSTSYGSLIPFNPEVTTGPSLIIPAAILMKFIGAKYWVPSFTNLLISMVLILIILVQVYQYYEENLPHPSKLKSWLLLSFALFYITVIWIPELMQIEFLGEFPSGLFVCAGILVIFRSYSRPNVIIGGMLLGFAIMSKLSSLIMVIAVCIVWVVFFSIDLKTTKFSGSKIALVLLITGLILPVVIFESWKFITLGAHGFLDNANWSMDFLITHGSGISETLSVKSELVDYLITNFVKNFEVLRGSDGIFRFYLYLFIFFGMIVSIISKVRTRTTISNIERVSITALFATTFYVVWWLLLSSLGWYRHLQPGIVVMSFAIIISILALFIRKAIVPLTVIMIIWIILYPSYWGAILERRKIPSELISATSKTINYLMIEKTDGRSLLGCGWWANRRLEYLMPSVLNFQDCYTSDLSGSDLVVDREFWNWEQNPLMIEIERSCSQLVFELHPYRIYRCK